MNPRYQVFVSSTFRDLQKERQGVLDAILELGHFPAGMEIFPAANATPWALIEKIIKQSDYYVLIIGGTYGSTDENGVSYTEKEYDLALASGVPVIACLHKRPDLIPAGLTELSPTSRKRLEAFRKKVEAHHCKYWENPGDLKSNIVLGLVYEIGVNPRIGWVRADSTESPETLKKLNSLMEDRERLEHELKSLRDVIGERGTGSETLACGEDNIQITFKVDGNKDVNFVLTWDLLLVALAPKMITDISIFNLQAYFETLMKNVYLNRAEQANLSAEQRQKLEVSNLDDSFNKIINQFMALEYIEPVTLINQTEVGGRPRTERYSGYKLTKHGVRTVALKQAIRRS